MNIGKYVIGKDRVFIIAEVGNNHNGSMARATQLIDLAVEAGADCVKFQMRDISSLYRESTLEGKGDDLGTEYIIDLLRKYDLTVDQHKSLFDYCRDREILYLCTPWDVKSADVLNDFGVEAFKIASADLTNTPLLEHISKFKKPLLISTGMSFPHEIKIAVDFLKQHEVNFALLHCNSTYPAPYQDINLRHIDSLRELHNLVGYSGHERGINVSVAAVARSACILERHITLDRHMEGPDHAASLTPEEFKALVEGVRQVQLALGTSKKSLSQGELINRENLGKSLVAARNILKGQTIGRDDIAVKSPGQGLPPQKLKSLIGCVAKREISYDDYFFDSDIELNYTKPRAYSFKRKWGVPVRFHDFHKYSAIVQPGIWEFHLSYGDMLLEPGRFINKRHDAGLVVHAPELFQDSHLLDLCSADENYRSKSISHMKDVIEITKYLRKFFSDESKPLIVINVGGFSMDKPLTTEQRNACYVRLRQSMKAIADDAVELIPQTMAPYPWHFGGQRYQNLLVDVNEIKEFCELAGLRMCLDLSHSKLACNNSGANFEDFVAEIAPLTAHIHVGDAQGVNGEGLQIGEGDINFLSIGKILNLGCPNASFIPEIWQGHKNFGEGFWKALEKLEGVI